MRDEDLKYIVIDFQARDKLTGELMAQEVMRVHIDRLNNFFRENGMEPPLLRRMSSQAQSSTSESSSSSQLSPPPVENVDPQSSKKKEDDGGSSSSGGGGDPKKWTMKSWRPVPPAEVSNSSSSAGAASLQYQEEEGPGAAEAGLSDDSSERSLSPPILTPVSGSSPKKIRLRSPKLAVLSPMIHVADPNQMMEQEDDGGPSPATAGPSTRPCPSPAAGSGRNSRKKKGRRGRGGNNFPNLKDSAVPLCTPPPARTKAKVVGVSAVPFNGWEKDLKNTEVILEELKKLPTEWGVIIADEPVYARWSDNKFYSGVVKEKGDNDTWIIEFDDSIEAPASKSHILPIRVLGVGVKGVYTPDQFFEAKDAQIIGQKFDVDYEPGTTYVNYAIKIVGETEPKWCSRRQLAIKGKEGIKLRKSVKIEEKDKGVDVSLDNIVFNRRRGRKPPPEIEKKTIEKSPKAREKLGKGGKAKKEEGKATAAVTLPKMSPPPAAAATTSTSKDIAAITMSLVTKQVLPGTSSKPVKPLSGPPAPTPPPPPPPPVSVMEKKTTENCEKWRVTVQDDSSEDELLDIPLLTSECRRRTIRAKPRPCLAVPARVRPSVGSVQLAAGEPVASTSMASTSGFEQMKKAGGKKIEQKENIGYKMEKGEECRKKKELKGNGKKEKDDRDEEEDENVESVEAEELEEAEEEEEEGKLEIVENNEEDGDEEDKLVEQIGIEEEDENNNGTDEGDGIDDENGIAGDDGHIFENIGEIEDDVESRDELAVDQNKDDDVEESMDGEEDLDEMEIDESSSSSSTKETTLKNQKKNTAPPFLKYDQYDAGNNQKKKGSRKGKKCETPPMPNIIIPLEPVPKPVKCFEGYQFYITSSDRQDKLVPSNVYEKYHTGSFNKETLIKMIEHGGGQVLGKIGSESSDSENTPFVISNCFSRTAEYLYGVEACYPCVDRKWIAKCLEQQRFVYWSNFTLPTGWSLEEKRVIMPHYQKPLEKRPIFMAPEKKYSEWGSIAKVGGCLNMNDIQIGPGNLLPPKVGILIILDEEMENLKAVIAEADKRHVRVVKHEWLIQTVITGQLARFNAPKYCIFDQKTVTTEEVKGDAAGVKAPAAGVKARAPGLKARTAKVKKSRPKKKPSSRLSEESLLSVGPV